MQLLLRNSHTETVRIVAVFCDCRDATLVPNPRFFRYSVFVATQLSYLNHVFKVLRNCCDATLVPKPCFSRYCAMVATQLSYRNPRIVCGPCKCCDASSMPIYAHNRSSPLSNTSDSITQQCHGHSNCAFSIVQLAPVPWILRMAILGLVTSIDSYYRASHSIVPLTLGKSPVPLRQCRQDAVCNPPRTIVLSRPCSYTCRWRIVPYIASDSHLAYLPFAPSCRSSASRLRIAPSRRRLDSRIPHRRIFSMLANNI